MKISKRAISGIMAALLLLGLTACGASPAGPAARSSSSVTAAPLAAQVTEGSFADVSADAWYAADVAYVTEHGIMGTVAEDSFLPGENAIRLVIVEGLWRAAGKPSVEKSAGFPDTDAVSVDWAAEKGVTNGYDDGRFHADDPVTREQFAAMLWRAADKPEPKADALGSFPDWRDISAYALTAALWAQENGIIHGRDGGIFDPKANVTRAEVAAILHRYLTGPAALLTEERIALRVGGTPLAVEWADNSSVDALKELLKDGPITLDMSDYGGFEKGAPLPETLPQNNEQMNTDAGDVILYQGRQFVIYYDRNSYSLTPLGKITGMTKAELQALLGAGNVSATLSLVAVEKANAEPVVYFTSDISAAGLLAVYEKLGWNPGGKVAVKVSTGEPPASNYLRPELIGDLVKSVNGAIVECNTAYGGSRSSSAMHRQVAADHGFTAIADFDLMDEDGEVEWPVTGGTRLDRIIVGSHAENYSDWLILSHYKGHQMAGFGGAIKNVGIGASSASGKVLVHSAGTRTSGSIMHSDQDAWLEALAEMVDGFVDHVGEEHIIYINVMNRLSVDCDCNGHPAEPDIHDIGILASTDPVALDQACYDLVSQAEGNTSLMNRIERQHGLHTLEHAEEIGLGSRAYTLVNID